MGWNLKRRSRRAALLVGAGEDAQAWSAVQGQGGRALRPVVPFPPGGSSGIPTRAVGHRHGSALGQAAFNKITSTGGKVAVSDSWLRLNPLTPADDKKREHFGRIDVLWVPHGQQNHVAGAPALATPHDTPIKGTVAEFVEATGSVGAVKVIDAVPGEALRF